MGSTSKFFISLLKTRPSSSHVFFFTSMQEDPNSGKTYWYNSETMETRWTDPALDGGEQKSAAELRKEKMEKAKEQMAAQCTQRIFAHVYATKTGN